MTLYRVLQEAIQNVEKHAQAARVTVQLAFEANNVVLLLEDDGVGFEAPQHLSRYASGGHFGLMGLQERVELVGGKVHIATGPGRGCKIKVEIPLERPGAHSILHANEFRSSHESSVTLQEPTTNDDKSADC